MSYINLCGKIYSEKELEKITRKFLNNEKAGRKEKMREEEENMDVWLDNQVRQETEILYSKPDLNINQTHIYFIQTKNGKNKKGTKREGLIKIGLAKNPWRRLSQLQTSQYLPLSIIALIENATHEDEKWVHNKFKQYKMRGEWYVPNKAVLRFINFIQETNKFYETLSKIGRTANLKEFIFANNHKTAIEDIPIELYKVSTTK